MQAWEVWQGSLSWSSVVMPEPRTDEVLIEVAYSGVCGSDLAKITKSPIPGPAWPWRPGHEIVGRRPGAADFVVVDPLVPCEVCARCLTGDVHLCPSLRRIGWDLPGGFAEQVVAPRRNVLPVPVGVEPAHAVLADTLAVALHGIRCGLPARSPGLMAVVGSGPLALCSAVVAAARGWSVHVVVRSLAKLDRVVRNIDASFAVIEETPIGHFDVVVDAASGQNDGGLATALALVRDGGVILVQNAYDPGVRLGEDLRQVFRRSLTLVGSFSYCRRHGAGDLPEALAMLQQHSELAAELVHTQVPLGTLDAAIKAAIAPRPKPIKTVLVPRPKLSK